MRRDDSTGVWMSRRWYALVTGERDGETTQEGVEEEGEERGEK